MRIYVSTNTLYTLYILTVTCALAQEDSMLSGQKSLKDVT
jgi:hypothetical protein